MDHVDGRSRRKDAKDDKKKRLCSELAIAIRKVQEQHVLSKQPKSDDITVEHVCNALEAVYLHELKNTRGQLWRELKRPNPKIPPEPSFWTFIDPLVSDEIKMQLFALRNSESDIRKCRSWVRLMVSKGLMISFVEDLQRHPGLLAFHYGGEAVLRDLEQSEVIIQLLKGLSVFQLNCDYTNARLNTWDSPVLHLAGIWTPPPAGSPLRNRAANERVSPPASDFDYEGITIIDLALDKYSKKKESLDTFTDSQLITNECLEQSPGSSRGGSSTSLDPEPPAGSYGAMLRSYARRSNQTKPRNIPAASNEEGRQKAPSVLSSTPSEGGGVKNEPGDFSLALSLDYEVVTPDGSVVSSEQSELQQQHVQSMTTLLTKLVAEKGLDSQNYHCAGCRRPIGIIFGQAKLCKYNGQFYCFDCHLDDERVIPARVLFNWDFRKHKVCTASCEFLDSISHAAVLNVQEINKALYMYIPELEETLKLRKQLRHLRDYLLTCKDHDLVEQFNKKVKYSHLYENEHLYSIYDLTEVHSGVLNERLRKAVRIGRKHVKQCALCSQKGFICEVCHSNQVIYPFDLEDTYQCSVCSAVYHSSCQPSKGNCPKCLRMQKRKEAASDMDIPTAQQA